MQVDVFGRFKFHYLISVNCFLLLTQLIFIVDTNMPVTPNPNLQMCSKTQLILSSGKYSTYQISSNITYVSRTNSQTFLAYSPHDDILIFIEPKYQLHVYNVPSVHLIRTLPTTDIVYVTSCKSLSSNDRYDLFFIYESRLTENFTSIRICEIHFNSLELNFEDKQCIQTLVIFCNKPNIRIYGFTIKYDHAGTNKSVLFISTDMGLMYTIFDRNTGSLIREAVILNDTLNEGNIVVTSTGVIYYANKQEHTIHELYILRDFRIRFGKIIKSNAIKSPFGLIADECHHLYISTKSMILVMLVQSYKTIRSIFSKASDLPITIERLNSTTYIYATIKKHSGKSSPTWMFNFLYFSDPEKTTYTSRYPVINREENVDLNENELDDTKMPKLWPVSGALATVTTDTHSSSTIIQEQTSPIEETTLQMHSLSTTQQSSSDYITSSTESTDSSTDDLQSTSSSSISSTEEISTQNSPSIIPSTISDIILNNTHHTSEIVVDHTTLSTDTVDKSSIFSTATQSDKTPGNTFATDIVSSTLSSVVTNVNTVHQSDQSFSTLDTIESTQLSSTTLDQTTKRTTESFSYLSITSTTLETTSLENQSYSTSTKTSDNTISDELSITVTHFIDKEMEDGINQKHFSPMLVEFNISSTLHSSSPFIVSSTTFLPSHSSELSPTLHPSSPHSTTPVTKLNRLLSSKHFSETTTSTTLSSSTTTLQTTDSAITSDIIDQTSITTLSDQSTSLEVTSYPDSTSTTSTLLLTTINDEFTTRLSNTFYDFSSPSYEISSESITTDQEELLTTTDHEELLTTTDHEELLTTTEHATFLTTTDDETLLTTTDHETLLTTTMTSTLLDSITTIQLDESSPFLLKTTDNEETFAPTNSASLETIPISSTSSSLITDEHSEGYISTQSSLEIELTTFPYVHSSKTEHSTIVVTRPLPRSNRPARRRTRQSTTTTPTTTTTTTNRPYRTRKQTITLWKSQPTITTASTTLVQTTSTHDKSLTSSPISTLHSTLNSLQQNQQTMATKPSNSSSALPSTELFNTLFSGLTDSSGEKFIQLNLADRPPSSWEVSFHTNASLVLDIVLPPPSNPPNNDAITNLTIANVDANRFSTNIVGSPINLQVDQIQTKQFSLAMNLTNNQTNNQTNHSLSDVVLGHVKSEQFQLNITKSDNMNLHVHQVDSDTAELFFNSEFCTSETNLQINLNLSKNGTIRYGAKTPLLIGSVFTRVHMLKQSCHLDQPFTLFFDICQGQNPCHNGGTCKSHVPNYNDPSYSQQDSSQINYQCICPLHMSGENCQHSQYPFGYCMNDGSLIYVLNDLNNQSMEQCLCLPGFQGHHCENNIDDCINIDCSKHGICQDGINTYKCACFDGFYGDFCQQTSVETVLLQVASKSFATVAIILIFSIAGLFVASDIHTYLTTKKQRTHQQFNRISRTASELFENSLLLLAFADAPIEMSDLSTVDTRRKVISLKKRPIDKRNQTKYQSLTNKKSPSNRYFLSNPSYETIL